MRQFLAGRAQQALAVQVMTVIFVIGAVIFGAATASAAVDRHSTERGALEASAGVSSVVASRDIAVQSAGSGLVGQLEDEMGTGYAGVWFDPKAEEFVVPQTRSVDPRSEIVQLMNQTVGPDHFRAASVRYTWDQLQSIHHRVDSMLATELTENELVTSINPKSNKVAIEFSDASSARSEAAIRAVLRRYPAAVEAVAVSPDRVEFETTACDAEYQSCDHPYRAGVLISGPEEGPEAFRHSCTGGFKAFGRTSGLDYVLTAAHCVSSNANWSAFDSARYSHYLGHVELSEWGPRGDVAAIQVKPKTGSYNYWKEGAWPNLVAFWGANTETPITSESRSYMGEVVCHSGVGLHGTACGPVTRVDLTMAYDPSLDGVLPAMTAYHEAEAAIPAIPGDSGGPVWSANSAVGIVSAGGPNTTIYTEATEATDALNLTIAPRQPTPAFVETSEALNNEARAVNLRGKVDPNGYSTSYWVEYGTSEQLGQKTSVANAGAGYIAAEVSQRIEGLTPGAPYYYRYVASSAAGNINGEIKSFTAAVSAPLLRRVTSVHLTPESHSLTAEVEPGGKATGARCDYGTTAALGSSVPAKTQAGGTELTVAGWQPVHCELTGLAAETVHYFRIVATNSVGSATTDLGRFTTLAMQPQPASVFGTGSGPFGRAIGVAVDAEGHVWTTDRETNRVQKFSSGGESLAQFGSKGSGNGQFSDPRGIAIGANGRVWVVDTGNDRVEYFSSAGVYEGQLKTYKSGGSENVVPYFQEPTAITVTGGYVYVSDYGNNSVLRIPEAGGSPQRFDEVLGDYQPFHHYIPISTPAGLASDAEGDVYMSDFGHNWVAELKPGESYWVPIVASEDVATGLQTPFGVAVKRNGTVIVADQEDGRVEQFAPIRVGPYEPPEFLATFGGKGSLPAQFNEPAGIAVGPGGNIYVADAGNHRISRWTQPMGPEATTLPATAVKGTTATLNGNVDPAGHPTKYQFEYGTGSSYGSVAPSKMALAGEGYDPVHMNITLTGLAPETTYHYRVVALNGKGTSYGSDRTFTTLPVVASITSFGSLGTGPGQFTRPLGVAVDASGNVWTTDSTNSRLQKFSSSGTFLAQFGSKGSGNGQFSDPRGIAIGANGRVWVVDTGNDRVEYFSSAGVYEGQLATFKLNGVSVKYFTEPTSVTVTHGYVYVGDYGNSLVVKIPEAGGTPSVPTGAVSTPAALASDAAGDVFLGNYGKQAIDELVAGESKWRQVATGHPTGILVKPNGNLLVAESDYNRLALYKPQLDGAGELLTTYGAAGSGSGQFSEPYGLAAAADGSVHIADAANHRIDHWSFE